MRKFALPIFLLFTTFGLYAQEIKTKVTESGFDLKPEATREEEFEADKMYIFLSGGYGRRMGQVTTGFVMNYVDPPYTIYQTTTNKQPFVDGIGVDLGFRNYFESNFGFGARGSLFSNKADFWEVVNLPGFPPQKARATTQIYDLHLEGMYRFYPSEKFKTYIYGGLGLGLSLIDQTQYYSKDIRTRTVSGSFFSFRPFVGVVAPIWERLHYFAETGYCQSEGSISEGTLSLSRFQIATGLYFRLNAF